MQLIVNGKTQEFALSTLTVTELLTVLNVEMPDQVSVQLNGEFLDRESFGTRVLKSGETVDFLYFLGGGCS